MLILFLPPPPGCNSFSGPVSDQARIPKNRHNIVSSSNGFWINGRGAEADGSHLQFYRHRQGIDTDCLHTRCSRGCSTNTFVIHSFIHSLTNSSISSKSSGHLHSQTIWARDLKFRENVHLPPCVTCHMSRVTCHISCVTCHVSHVACHMSHFFSFLFFLDKVVELVGGVSVINRAYPV